MVAEHYIIEFYMISHFKAAQNLVAQHFERDFALIFRLKVDQNLVVEHCEWDFYMIFHFKEAQNVVAEHYGRGWMTGLTPMTMNNNRFNLVDSGLHNFARKKARRL